MAKQIDKTNKTNKTNRLSDFQIGDKVVVTSSRIPGIKIGIPVGTELTVVGRDGNPDAVIVLWKDGFPYMAPGVGMFYIDPKYNDEKGENLFYRVLPRNLRKVN